MAHTFTTGEILAGPWSIREMVTMVQSIIDEIEGYVAQNEALPQGLVQGLYETIDNIEAEILRRRAALPLAQGSSDGYDLETTHPQSEDEMRGLSVSPSQGESTLHEFLAIELGPANSQNPGVQSTNKESQPAQADQNDVLGSLQDNVKAIQSVVLLRKNSSMLSRTRSTISMVSMSILEEETKILDELLEQAAGVYEPSNHLNSDGVEKRLMDLPTQLSALFNMEIQEATQGGSEIDDKVMMHMVIENQKRTDVLRQIELIAFKVKEATQHATDQARSGEQSSAA